ncbi:hypothetical protein RYX36_002227 [Vicia faba]
MKIKEMENDRWMKKGSEIEENGVFVIDITAFVDQEHPFVEVWNLLSEAFAAYLVAKDLVVVANSFVVANMQVETEFVSSIAVLELVVVTNVLW